MRSCSQISHGRAESPPSIEQEEEREELSANRITKAGRFSGNAAEKAATPQGDWLCFTGGQPSILQRQLTPPARVSHSHFATSPASSVLVAKRYANLLFFACCPAFATKLEIRESHYSNRATFER
jgi:hypothetical protein